MGKDAAPALPEGLRIYAIGDIHGCFDLWEMLCGQVRRDLARSPSARTIEIFLGDYIDRGPQSREMLEWLIDGPPIGDERICLMGNHEDLLLRAFLDPRALPNWISNGGMETLASYGVAANQSVSALHAALRTIPQRHREFLGSLRRTAEFGDYFFVHAGVRPGVPLSEQDPEDLVWIREAFLRSQWDFGRIIVHGHTPTRLPEIRPNRINIDTGAVFTGCLTALVLEGTDRRFLHARAGPPLSASD